MAVLTPYPFDLLIARMIREWETKESIFGLPARKFFLGPPDLDLTVRHHGKPASSPLAPAAGPHTQMAQNIVLAWLGGCRLFELKTVQIKDDLEIPRPCIDMQTIGYNVEWSQELRIAESLEEYVKAAMLIRILRDRLGIAPRFQQAVFDMSVGYDLGGIKSDPVRGFMAGMMATDPTIDRLRRQIPDAYKAYRDLDFQPRLADTLTLSTFHGCPPDEIERICLFLMEEMGLHCTVKLNPTLLGPADVRSILHDRLGYHDVVVPDEAFENDTRWDQMAAFTGRLGDRAAALGLGFGVKFTNTLIVENRRRYFPESEKVMYLSGQPLHVLAMELVRRFRRLFGDHFPISFSAGIESHNFPDAVALGLVPVSVCSDFLRPGGYGRAQLHLNELCRRMQAVGASDIEAFIRKTAGEGVPNVSAARLTNSEAYVDRLLDDPRYGEPANRKPPRKVDSTLVLFDCLTCDKCLPACPNDANFTYRLPAAEISIRTLRQESGRWVAEDGGVLAIKQKHQIGNFADFCNDCGNCDVFCPELGGPYILKPRFFGRLEAWASPGAGDGFHIARRAGAAGGPVDTVHARLDGVSYRAEFDLGARSARFSGPGFDVSLALDDPEGSIAGTADGPVDITRFRVMDLIRQGVMAEDAISYVRDLAETGTAAA